MTARQCIATLCLVALLPSCMTFRPYDGVPPDDSREVRVTLHGGTQTVLYGAQQMGDQYVGGLQDGDWFVGCTNCLVRSIPMDSIAGFEVSETNAGGTAWAIIVFGGAAVVAGAALLVALMSYEAN
jgi:hypothetical protein